MILRAEIAFGPPHARRYVIVNFETGEAWSGTGFVKDWNSAIKYASPSTACCDMQMLLRRAYEHLPVTRYAVPLVVDVYGDVSPGEVATWLHASTLLHVRTHEFGNGPNKSLVCPTIYWPMIEPLNEDEYRIHPEMEEDKDEDF